MSSFNFYEVEVSAARHCPFRHLSQKMPMNRDQKSTTNIAKHLCALRVLCGETFNNIYRLIEEGWKLHKGVCLNYLEGGDNLIYLKNPNIL